MLTNTGIHNAKSGNKPIELADGRGLYIETLHLAEGTGVIASCIGLT